MQQHPVDTTGALIRLRRNIIGRIEHGLAPRVDGVLAGRGKHRRALPLLEGRQPGPQVVDSRPVVRDDRGHRDAQRRRQRLDVDSAAAGGQFVAHGQCQQARQVEPEHLADQQDRPAQRGHVGDQHHRIRPADVRILAGQQVGHHLLVRADRVEAVGAGQVFHGNRDAVHGGGADAASDGYSRVVTGLGAQPGQMVEDAGLARVRTADQRHPPDAGEGNRGVGDVMARGHRSTSGTTSMSCASRRRRHSSVSCTR